MFSRAAADGVPAALETALSRLQYPYRLSEEARDVYERWILGNSTAAVCRLTGLSDEPRIRFLAERGFITAEAAGAGIGRAAEKRLSGILGILMECEHAGRACTPAAENFEL